MGNVSLFFSFSPQSRSILYDILHLKRVDCSVRVDVGVQLNSLSNRVSNEIVTITKTRPFHFIFYFFFYTSVIAVGGMGASQSGNVVKDQFIHHHVSVLFLFCHVHTHTQTGFDTCNHSRFYYSFLRR